VCGYDLRGTPDRAIAPVAEATSKAISPAQRKEWTSGTPASAWPRAAARRSSDRTTLAEQIKRAGVQLATVVNAALR
jgi:hypothetical protein